MKIIVCVKQIQHTYTRTGREYEACYIRPEDSIRRINPFDEAATELALCLKDSLDNTSVTLLTLGDMIAEDELRRCLAAGADDLVRLPAASGMPDAWGINDVQAPFYQPDPSVKAALIAQAARRLGADLILCGKESLDRGNGQVGARVAHNLGLPFVSAITDLSFDGANQVFKAQRSAGRGVREVIQCACPAVFSVDTGASLRLPALKNKIKAAAYSIGTPDMGDTCAFTAKVTCKTMFQPRPRPLMTSAPDSAMDAYDRILHLLSGSRTEKKGEILTGSVDAQVEGLIEFLKKNECIGRTVGV